MYRYAYYTAAHTKRYFENDLGLEGRVLTLSREINGSTAIIHIVTLAARGSTFDVRVWARILVQVTIYRRLLIGRDGHLDTSEAYDLS